MKQRSLSITELMADLAQFLVDNGEDYEMGGVFYSIDANGKGPRVYADFPGDSRPSHTITEVISELGRMLIKYGDLPMGGSMNVAGHPFPAVTANPVQDALLRRGLQTAGAMA